MTGLFQRMWRQRRGWVIAVFAICLIGILTTASFVFGARNKGANVSAQAGIPTALVTRGDLVDTVELRGQVQAFHTSVLEAPSDSGDIQIMKLAKDGALVHKGEEVAVFDAIPLQVILSQRRSDLKQAEAQVDDANAQAKLTEEQDQTDLQKANYDVERARLDASQAEILSEIDGQEKKLALADAEQKLKQAQQKLISDKAGAKATLAGIEARRQKALRDVKLYEDRISKLTLYAPVDGIVNLLPNWRASGMFGNNAPNFKEGDRGRLRSEQSATARVDAVPDHEFVGKVTIISPLAKIDFSNGWPPAKNFDVTVLLEHPDPRLRPGMSVTERIAVERIPNVIMVPSAAVFTKNGLTQVYVMQAGKSGENFTERSVVLGRRGGGNVEIRSGLQPGERVALKDPSVTGKS
jgi:HlyD family secretion protein